MKRYRVVIPPLVEEQIRSQVLYIAHNSVDNALKWEDRLRATIKKLALTPGGYPIDEAATKRLGEEVRKLVFERTYLLFYRINRTNCTVEIINFRHGARLPRANEP